MKFVKFNFSLILFLLFCIITSSIVEKNEYLSSNNIGLFQHPTFWVFIISNLYIIIYLYYIHKILKENLSNKSFVKIQNSFNEIVKTNRNKVIYDFFVIFGFIFFVGNSLQNVKLINYLPFEFWDSTTYILSFITSRIYKFYLFTIFLPNILWYLISIIYALSNVILINEKISYIQK